MSSLKAIRITHAAAYPGDPNRVYGASAEDLLAVTGVVATRAWQSLPTLAGGSRGGSTSEPPRSWGQSAWADRLMWCLDQRKPNFRVSAARVSLVAETTAW
jgi:hypothetical protein